MLRSFLLGSIKAYQWFLSPLLGPHCRFHPSCSGYAHEAIRVHGVRSGTWLGIKRVCRCHPLNQGGFDPVPAKRLSRG